MVNTNPFEASLMFHRFVLAALITATNMAAQTVQSQTDTEHERWYAKEAFDYAEQDCLSL